MSRTEREAIFGDIGQRSSVRLTGISKRFEGVRALRNVDLNLKGGQIRGLVGTNGSGKSTLVKVIAGYHKADAGSVHISGEQFAIRDSVKYADRWHVSAVHQDLGMIPGVSVLENFLLPYTQSAHDFHINWPKLQEGLRERLANFGVAPLPTERIEDVDRVTRAIIALARAVWKLEGCPSLTVPISPTESVVTSQGTQRQKSSSATNVPTMSAEYEFHAPPTLILDEITAFMSRKEVSLLRALVEKLANDGLSILLVSHDLDEILSFTEAVTVLRDGAVVADRPTEGFAREDLFEMITGRRPSPAKSLSPGLWESKSKSINYVRVSQLAVKNHLSEQISFEVAPREILGITGLIGSGFECIPYALFGELDGATGTMDIGESHLGLDTLSPMEAMRHDVALVPADRLRFGLWADLSIGDNLFQTVTAGSARPWKLSWRSMWRDANKIVERYGIRAPSARTRIGQLSGGNQQRVLLAKWLELRPQLLLLHEPVQGVDVGAREELSALIRERAVQGMSVICGSIDYEFLASVATRVLIFARGRIVDELTVDRIGIPLSKEAIVWACQSSPESSGVTDPPPHTKNVEVHK